MQNFFGCEPGVMRVWCSLATYVASANPSAGREESDFALNAESNGYTETANRNPKKRGNGTY